MGMKISIALFGVCTLLAPRALAVAVDSTTIYPIAMTGEAAPGGGSFTSFSAPTTDGDTDHNTGGNPFWFIAATSNGSSGVYVYDAVANAFADLVDTTQAAPTGGNFASFSSLSSGLGAVGFIGTDTNGVQGVYGVGYIPLTLIATANTSPSAGISIGNLESVSISGNPYGDPAGIVTSSTGVYLFIENSGSYAFYGGYNNFSFSSFGPVSYKGIIGNSLYPGLTVDASAFTANLGGVRGVYFYGPGAISAFLNLANVGGSIPSGTGTFTSFGNPYVTANEVAFTAHYNVSGQDQQGVFVYGGYISGGTDPFEGAPSLQQIAASGQVAPNSHGAAFSGFSDISDTSYDTTFLASLSDGNEGLYINYTNNPYPQGPQIVKVIETGDTLSGKIVDGISLAPDASNFYDETGDEYTNTGIGFEVDFTDGSEGLYYFTVSLPEPGLFCLLLLSTLLFSRRRIANARI